MLRAMILSLAAATAAVGVVGCQSDGAVDDIEAGARAACRDKNSTPENPTYDEACMREVRDQIEAARQYRPSTKPPPQKK